MIQHKGFWHDRARSLIVRGAVTLGLATTALAASVQPAFALEVGVNPNDPYQSAYNFVDGATNIRLQSARESLPEQFDLRDYGYVTPVKFQNPWGTCWSFGAIAACETSMLSEAGVTYDQYPLDLSERQLAYFGVKGLPAENPGDYDGQAGEGGYNALLESDVISDPEFAEQVLGYPLENALFNAGGISAFATSLFSDGIGPVIESDAPYQNDEGIVDEHGYNYSTAGTWSLPEALRFYTYSKLEESFVMPSPATFDENGTYSYNADATAAMKEQLLAGRALEIFFKADASRPGQASSDAYMNPDTWGQYTYERVQPDHLVAIVGWDDNYSKENFNEGHQPPEDGAWIVKNSWGAASQEFPNQYDYGDDGYFYLSYYDQSIYQIEAFDFDINGYETDLNGEFIANQYDYMPRSMTGTLTLGDEDASANVFTASDAQTITSVSCETAVPNTKVTYRLYRLADNAANPTDGELISTVEETYEFGGYHVEQIPEADRAKATFAKGEKFSVVVKMESLDGGGTYAIVQAANNENAREQLIGMARANEEATHAIRNQMTERFRAQYLAEHPEATDEEVEEYLAASSARIDEGVEVTIQASSPIYYSGVVNRGESYVSESGAWTDLADLLTTLDEMLTQGLQDIDNFPIKAYGDPIDLPFPDVDYGTWYFDAVAAAKEAGAMGGYDDGTFGPLDPLAREQAAAVMWNLLGEGDESAPTADFADVEQDAWYSNVVNWAVEQGAMGGYDDSDEFGIGDTLTREQFCAVVANVAGADLSEVDESVLDAFTDADGVSTWARPAVAWAVEAGVVNGVELEDGFRALEAGRGLNRAEMAAMVVNALNAGVLA